MNVNETEQRLRHIFFDLKARFRYQSDQDRYGLSERWESFEEVTAMGGWLTGDCELFATAARIRVLESLPGVQTYLVAVTTETPPPNYHCVCLVDNGQSAWVLDNRMGDVMYPEQLIEKGYVTQAMSLSDPYSKEKWRVPQEVDV